MTVMSLVQYSSEKVCDTFFKALTFKQIMNFLQLMNYYSQSCTL